MVLGRLQLAIGLAAVVALPCGATEALSTGGGTLQARASVDFQVRIPSVMRIALIDHPATLNVTAEDSAAGEVLVEGAQVHVVANDPRGYTLQADLSGPVAEASIEGLSYPVLVRSGGAAVAMPSMVGQARPQPKRVQYRFHLAKGTAPGTYAWPLALSLAHP